MIDWDSHIEGDYCSNNPTRVLDCPYCDGTYWPEETHCSFCKKQVVSDEEIKRREDIELQIFNDDVKRGLIDH